MSDLISRQRDCLKELMLKYGFTAPDMTVTEFVEDILPSAQPERKKRRWIKGINENGVTTSLFCSECNYENKHWYEWNFCPNCGADMRGEANEGTVH